MIGISPTHMSHIETGSTKLSLPVLIDLFISFWASKTNLDLKNHLIFFNFIFF